jgi:hypothetical protein
VSIPERTLLILVACYMVVDPLDFTLWGVAPTLVGGALVTWYWLAPGRRKDAAGAVGV